MDLKDLETKLRAMLEGQYSSMSIMFNDDAAPYYQTVAEYETQHEGDPNPFGLWINDEEKLKGMETNSKWTIQWYPFTPNGFKAYSASSLETLLIYVTENYLDLG